DGGCAGRGAGFRDHGPARSLSLPARGPGGRGDDLPHAGRRALAPARHRVLATSSKRSPEQGLALIERIRTRVADLLGIRYPILQAGMIWASGYKLAVACSEADILGCIGSAGMNQDLLRSQIRKAHALTKKKIAVNIPL